MLIERVKSPSRQQFGTPSTSLDEATKPRTRDVHLYADPYTWLTQRPRLYADGDGLDGGEVVPQPIRHRGAESDLSSDGSRFQSTIRPDVEVEKNDLGSGREIGSEGRGLLVSHLLYRPLYTFSDTVVFVLNTNTRYVLLNLIQR